MTANLSYYARNRAACLARAACGSGTRRPRRREAVVPVRQGIERAVSALQGAAARRNGVESMKCEVIALQVDAKRLAGIDAYARKHGLDRHEAARALIEIGAKIAEGMLFDVGAVQEKCR